MLLIIQPLLHPKKRKNDLTNLMTPLTFGLYWQWCSKREPVSSGALSSSGLCAVFNYLRGKITVVCRVSAHVGNFLLSAILEEVLQLQNQMFHGLVAC